MPAPLAARERRRVVRAPPERVVELEALAACRVQATATPMV